MASDLGMKIGARRRELGMSLERLAELSGSSKSYLWELENRDKPNPSLEKANRIALALKIAPEALFNTAVEAKGEVDNAFFKKFQQLKEGDKERLRKIVDDWWTPDE